MYNNRKYIRLLAALLLLITITILMSKFPFPESDTSPIKGEVRHQLRSQTIWFFFLIVTGFSLAIELLFELFEQIISKQELESEKNKATLALYKSQIDPHFLFNTLNTLYGLVINNSSNAEKAFVRFSEILKYMYRNSSSNMINIRDEISYINNYVELQKLRVNRHTKITLVTNIINDNIMVPSMMMITFIENAFKYGSSSDEDSEINIYISAVKNTFYFKATNRINDCKNKDSSSVGLDNCKKRLELLYRKT